MSLVVYVPLFKIVYGTLHFNLTSNILREIGPFCLYRAWLVMDDWLIIIGFKTALTTHMKESVGVFLFYLLRYICDRDSPEGWSQTKDLSVKFSEHQLSCTPHLLLLVT